MYVSFLMCRNTSTFITLYEKKLRVVVQGAGRIFVCMVEDDYAVSLFSAVVLIKTVRETLHDKRIEHALNRIVHRVELIDQVGRVAFLR